MATCRAYTVKTDELNSTGMDGLTTKRGWSGQIDGAINHAAEPRRYGRRLTPAHQILDYDRMKVIY